MKREPIYAKEGHIFQHKERGDMLSDYRKFIDFKNTQINTRTI